MKYLELKRPAGIFFAFIIMFGFAGTLHAAKAKVQIEAPEKQEAGVQAGQVPEVKDVKINYPSGKLQAEVTGTFSKTYYESGQLMAEMPIENGLPNGMAKTYYENGKISTESEYKNGRYAGTTKFYNDKGELMREPHLPEEPVKKEKTIPEKKSSPKKKKGNKNG